MRGRKPTIRLPEQGDEPVLPTCPEGLPDDVQATFEHIAGLLYDQRTVKELDRFAIAMFAQSWALWLRAQTEIAATAPVVKSSAGAAVLNPWLTVSGQAFKTMATIIPELGLSPTARQRLKLKPKAKQTASKWEGLIANG